jgi:hypothetical protein
MVADAVHVEPVSIAKFPANREKNREFFRIAVSVGSETVNNTVVTGLPKRIPYSTEQGIILTEQGIFAREQGFLSGGIEIIAERDFRYIKTSGECPLLSRAEQRPSAGSKIISIPQFGRTSPSL